MAALDWAEWAIPALNIAETIADTSSALSRGKATEVVGARKRQAAEFEAAQLRQQAEQAGGIGMQVAADEVRKTMLVNSAALARAAASGAGASDPTVLNVLARTASVGAHRAAVAMYQGEEQARVARLRATAAELEGDIAVSDAGRSATAAKYTAASTLLSGATKGLSLYDKYFSSPQSGDDGGWVNL